MLNQLQIALGLTCLLLWNAGAAGQDVSPRFCQLDRNQDGKLTRDELSGALFEQIDTNKDGMIRNEEGLALNRSALSPRLSPVLPASVEGPLNLAYAGTDNPRQRLDLYLPKNVFEIALNGKTAAAPCVSSWQSKEGAAAVSKWNCPSDLSDQQWQVVKKYVPRPATRGRKPICRRRIFHVIMYVVRSSCQWRMLPGCYPN